MRHWLSVSAFVLLLGCQPPVQIGAPVTSDPNAVKQSFAIDQTDGTLDWGVSPLSDVTSVRSVELDLSLPSGGARVYYLLTNVSTSTSSVSLSSVDPLTPLRAAAPQAPLPRPDRWTRIEKPQPQFPPSGASVPRARTANPFPRSDVYTAPVLNDSFEFVDRRWDTGALVQSPTKLRLQRTVDGRTLNIWVADDSWDGDGNGTVDAADPGDATEWYVPDHLVKPAMVTALADKFLKADLDDIYHWVTGIFGKEWSEDGVTPPFATGITSTVPPAIDGHGEINIFIKNLNPGSTANGVLMGYFDPTNDMVAGNYAWWDTRESNEKILFALDADSLANPDDDGRSSTTDAGVWSTTDYWPSEMISTLAHEFQHMIHFYQKQVLQQTSPSGTQAWINEMASMVTEDFVADKLGVKGPRGVAVVASVGSENDDGRLPMFNYYHDSVALTDWSNTNSLPNYSQAYAFGAWLARNFGGPELFRDIVQRPQINYTAVVNAVNAVGGAGTQTYRSLVLDWGLATFLQSSSGRQGLQYRSAGDGTYEFTDGAETYVLGPIDLGTYYQYNYSAADPWGDLGPLVHSGGFRSSDKVAGGGTFIFDAGSHSGSFKKSLQLPANIVLTVVVRDE